MPGKTENEDLIITLKEELLLMHQELRILEIKNQMLEKEKKEMQEYYLQASRHDGNTPTKIIQNDDKGILKEEPPLNSKLEELAESYSFLDAKDFIQEKPPLISDLEDLAAESSNAGSNIKSMKYLPLQRQ